jgi:lipoprotein-anchoring transpeptidase ErfK/SrfK
VAAQQQHGISRRSRRGWWLVATVGVGVVGVAAVIGGLVVSPGSRVTHSASAGHRVDQAAARRARAVAALAAAVQFDPSPGATGLPLNQVVTVSAGQGRLTDVQASTAAGQVLSGTLAATGTQWVAPGPLLPGASYTVTAAVADGSGITARSTSTFTALTPTAEVTASVTPESGSTVGAGEPISVRFDHQVPVAAQSTVLSHLRVSMSQVVPGGWYWFSAHELHFRPQTYWPSGDQVSFASDLNGWTLGDGAWGTGTASVHFTIGATNISTANLTTERMTVTSNGKVVWVFPISAGRTQYPTMNGTHIALGKQTVVHMVSSTVGIPVHSANGYDEYVYNDVAISDSGEYVHAAPWSVSDQGVVNVSHGCINMSNANSLLFYKFTQPGDVINVVAGTRPPAYGDHGVMDWTTPWTSWVPATVAQTTA